jgi:hypothetical protein
MLTTSASACLLLLEQYDSPEIINVGCGEDIRFANWLAVNL